MSDRWLIRFEVNCYVKACYEWMYRELSFSWGWESGVSFIFLQIEEDLAKKIDDVQGKVMHLLTRYVCVSSNKKLSLMCVCAYRWNLWLSGWDWNGAGEQSTKIQRDLCCLCEKWYTHRQTLAHISSSMSHITLHFNTTPLSTCPVK